MKYTGFCSPLWLLAFAFLLFFIPFSGAQSCGFSTDKSLLDWQLSIQKGVVVADFTAKPVRQTPAFPHLFSKPNVSLPPGNGVFLPRWSAEDLPFFCKIEHDLGKNHARVPIKFRLGSVEYVDRLEGKNVPLTIDR